MKGMMDALVGMKDSVVYIGDCSRNFVFYLTHPLVLLKDGLTIVMPVAHLGLLVVSAAVILMAILGNRKHLKKLPTAFVIYLLMKVLVAVL